MKRLFLIVLLLLISALLFAADPVPNVPSKPVPPATQPGDNELVPIDQRPTIGEMRSALWAGELLNTYYDYAVAVHGVAVDALAQNSRLIVQNTALAQDNKSLSDRANRRGVAFLVAVGTTALFAVLFALK